MQANNSSSSHSKDSNNSSSHSKDNIGTVVSLDGGGGGVGDVLDFESMDRDLILRDWILSYVQWSWSSELVTGTYHGFMILLYCSVAPQQHTVVLEFKSCQWYIMVLLDPQQRPVVLEFKPYQWYSLALLYVFFRSSATSSGRGAQTLLMVYIIVLWFY